MQQATNTNSATGTARVSRAHNNRANYFGNTNGASIFSAIIRASARPPRASIEATGPSFSLGRRRRTHIHANVYVDLNGTESGVGQGSFENLADTLSVVASALGRNFSDIY